MLSGGKTSESALEEILKSLGLSSIEARFYLELARAGRLTAAECARKAGVPRSEAYEILRKLESKGFIRQLLGKPAKFEPVDPLELRNKILNDERKRLSSVEAGMSKILEIWPYLRAMHLPMNRMPRVATIRGRKRIAAALENMISGAQESVSISTTRRGLLTAREYNFQEISKDLISRGVEIRMMLDEASAKALPASIVPNNLDVRVSKGPKTRFYLVDDREVIYHLHLQSEDDLWGSDEVALWTDSPDQVSVYGWLFKNEWDTSVPLQKLVAVSHGTQQGRGD